MAEHRRDRVAHLLHHELAGLLQKTVSDPRLAGVTITAVQITADLKIARVFFRTLADQPPRSDVERALRRAAPFLRGQLGRALGMRSTPELRFSYDTLPDAARRVDALLHDVRPPGGPSGAAAADTSGDDAANDVDAGDPDSDDGNDA